MKSLRALPVDRHHWENPGSYALHFLGSQWLCPNHVKWLLLPTIFGTNLESPIDVFPRRISYVAYSPLRGMSEVSRTVSHCLQS
jgi:hypothetical protein